MVEEDKGSGGVAITTEMYLALAPFIEAARHGQLVYDAVNRADLKGNGLGRGFEGTYAAVNCAQSKISWADWRELLAVWDENRATRSPRRQPNV